MSRSKHLFFVFFNWSDHSVSPSLRSWNDLRCSAVQTLLGHAGVHDLSSLGEIYSNPVTTGFLNEAYLL
jgi:hypothetical protein